MPKSNLDKIKPITPKQTSKYPSIGQKTSSTPTLAGGSPIPTEKASGAGKNVAQNSGKSTDTGGGNKRGTGAGKPIEKNPLASAMKPSATTTTAPWVKKDTTPTTPSGNPIPKPKPKPSASAAAVGAVSGAARPLATSSASAAIVGAEGGTVGGTTKNPEPTAPGKDGAGGTGGSGTAAGEGSTVTIEKKKADIPDFKSMLDQWLSAAKQQQEVAINYGTEQGVDALQRAEEDAQQQFQAQQRQIAIDEARGLDNQALYAEARGDKGGIGATQYNNIMNTAAQNRMTVSQQRTKLATDTARQIADLRAQGEYKKADAVLELTQKYLTQLMSLEQWALNYQLDVDQFNLQMEKWQAEYAQSSAELNGTSTGGTSSGGAYTGGSGGSGGSSGSGVDPSSMTATEVKAWQRKLGVTADGIWGPNTQAAYEAFYDRGGSSTQFTGTRPNTIRTSLDYSPDEGIFTYAGKTYGTISGVVNAINSANLSDAEFAQVKAKLEALTGVKWQ